MCPEQSNEQRSGGEGVPFHPEMLPGAFGGEDQDRFGFVRGETGDLLRDYLLAAPGLHLGTRLYRDPTIRQWVDELRELPEPERDRRIDKISQGAPRGAGRRVIRELFQRAAREGRSAFVRSFPFAAVVEPRRKPQRGAKGGEHDLHNGLEAAADRLVRSLVAYPVPIEPVENPEAMARRIARLVAEVEARLTGDRTLSPTWRRRAASLTLPD